MDGFHQFLPDRNVQRQAALKLDNVQGSSSRGRDGELKKKRGDPASSTPQQQGAGGAVPQKRKRRALERDGSLKEKEIVSGKGGPGSSKVSNTI